MGFLEDGGVRFGPQIHIPRDWRLLSHDSSLILGLWQGYFGVHLFFVLSGFVLGLPFVRQSFSGRAAPSIQNYFLRRITRIEPPYILNLLVCFGLLAWYAPLAADTWKHLLASLLYVHNLVYSQGSTINGVAWSLEIEVQFYILAPLFARAAFAIRRDWLRRTVLAAAIVGFSAFTQFVLWRTSHEDLKMSLLAYMQFFLAGFLLADLHQTGAINNRRNSREWDVIGLAGAVVTLLTMMYWRKWLFCALPFFVLVFYAGAFQGRLLRRFFVAGPTGRYSSSKVALSIEKRRPWSNALVTRTAPREAVTAMAAMPVVSSTGSSRIVTPRPNRRSAGPVATI